jgi:two-component system sensor histidine kinase PhoQ
MGVVLNRAFEQSVLSNAEDALRNQILLLIANIDVVDGKVVVPPLLPEPRLSQIDSNLYAQIALKGQKHQVVVWRSRSLLDKSLPEQSSRLGLFQFFDRIENDSPDWQNLPSLYMQTLGVEWETDDGDFPFTVQVAEHSTAYLQRLGKYQRKVGLSLLILGTVLIALLLLLLGWALNPLKRVARQVGEIEQGQRQRFDEDYPLEVSRLTQNLNQLLNFDEQRINRQKEVLGNLAHSLKTPIAVLNGLAYPANIDLDARHQLQGMQTIIDYQLQSASAVGRRRFAKPILVAPLTKRIIDSLQKVHAEKQLKCHISVKPDAQFYGDEGDWMELAGNIIDNAFKWADSTVLISIENTLLGTENTFRHGIRLTVDDDGPGIDENLRQSILERGVRLDSQTPGHGIGLHIVKGIIDAYQGDLQLGSSKQASSNEGTFFNISLN